MAREDYSDRRKAQPSGRRTSRRKHKERNTLPRLDKVDNNNMDKMPSNAPTMAIAPSDYEHIYHEGPPKTNNAYTRSPQTHREQTISPSSPTNPAQTYTLSQKPPVHQPTLPPMYQPLPTRSPDMPSADYNIPEFGRARYAQEVQVTPDGYTLLGHKPDPVRRIPLPPHIVRSSNQFSRAALTRVARYLASRANGN